MVEVIAVVAILGILLGIAVPSVLGIIEKSRSDVCHVNSLQLERVYERYLGIEGIEHSDFVFIGFFQSYEHSICPEDGEIRYLNGKIHCNLHPWENKGEDGDEEAKDVPFL